MMMGFLKKNFYLIVFGAVLFGKSEFNFADSQSGNIEADSLIHILKSEKLDKNQVELLNKISWIYLEYDFNNGFKYADSALKLSREINWDYGIAESYNNLGLAFRYNGEISTSIEYHSKALNIHLNKNEKVKIAETYSYLGISYFNISSFPQAFNYFNKSLKIFRDINDEKGIAKCLSYIGILHSSFLDFEKALKYFEQSLVLEEKLDNKNNIAIQLGNIGTTYYELKDYTNALKYFDKTLKLLEELNDYYNYSTFIFNSAKVYADIKIYSKAEEYYKKSLQYAEETDDQYLIAYIKGEMGNLYLKIITDPQTSLLNQEKNKFLQSAIENLTQASKNFMALGNEDERKNFLLSLSQAYKLNGEYLKALETFTTAKEIQDSIYSKENKRIIAEMEIKQQLDIKEKEIELLNKEKENEKIIQYSLIGFTVVFVFISGASIFFFIKTKKDNSILHENIITRKAAENKLREYQNNLEQLVSERTKKLEEEMTEREKIEEALIQSEEKYRMLIDFAVDGFFQGDMNGNFITVNNKAAEQTGYSKEELLNMNMKDLFSPTVLEEKPLQYDLLKKGETFKTEREILKKDGSSLLIEMNSRIMPDGTYQSFFSDISAQKRTQNELEKQNLFSEQMYLQSATSTQILDAEGWCLRINPKLSEFFGVIPEDIEGKKYNIFRDEEIKRKGIDKLLQKVIDEKTTVSWEVNFDIGVAADSQNIKVNEKKKAWFANKAYPIIDADGKLIYIIIQHENITERKNAVEELILAKEKAETVSKAKTIFLANMSHELRTPLVGILGYSELLSKELENPDSREMAEGINRTGKRLLNTLSLVLDLTRVESEKFEIEFKSNNLIQILKDSFDNFRGTASLKNIEYKFLPHTNSLLINTDYEMIKSVADNLINNAIKFTESGEISISTGIENNGNAEKVYFKVADTGIGIEEKDIAAIFQEFKQLSEGTTKGWQGTGLGLSITKKYVELLGGKITVVSKLGEGSLFKVELPI